jgi:uncharacterized ion transporter superfamily protein YfcC
MTVSEEYYPTSEKDSISIYVMNVNPNEWRGKMSVKQTKSHIKQLKQELKSTNNANDLRLLKLFVLLILLAAVAVLIHGRINFFLI